MTGHDLVLSLPEAMDLGYALELAMDELVARRAAYSIGGYKERFQYYARRLENTVRLYERLKGK